MVINWVNHVQRIVKHTSEQMDAESNFPICKLPVIQQSIGPKAKIVYEQETISELTAQEKQRLEWIRIKANRSAKTNLFDYWYAQRNAPSTHSIGRRHAKGKAAGCGQILKKSFVKPQIAVER